MIDHVLPQTDAQLLKEVFSRLGHVQINSIPIHVVCPCNTDINM